MLTVVSSTLQLYRDALHATGRSLVRGWFVILAVIVFTLLMMLAHQIARPLGMLGGFLLGAVNALLIGATLSLIEQCIKGMRTISMQDVMESMGHYFWDVISVGFVLWIPTMLLDTSLRANPDSQFLVMACLLLVFILLNPAPEVLELDVTNPASFGTNNVMWEFTDTDLGQALGKPMGGPIADQRLRKKMSG